jgi:hypothetical protein
MVAGGVPYGMLALMAVEGTVVRVVGLPSQLWIGLLLGR